MAGSEGTSLVWTPGLVAEGGLSRVQQGAPSRCTAAAGTFMGSRCFLFGSPACEQTGGQRPWVEVTPGEPGRVARWPSPFRLATVRRRRVVNLGFVHDSHSVCADPSGVIGFATRSGSARTPPRNHAELNHDPDMPAACFEGGSAAAGRRRCRSMMESTLIDQAKAWIMLRKRR